MPSPPICFRLRVDHATTEAELIVAGDAVYSQSVRTGGHKIEAAIAAVLRENRGVAITPETAAKLRECLADALTPTADSSLVVEGHDEKTDAAVTLEVHTAEVSHAVAPVLEEIVETIMLTLDRAPPPVAAAILDQGIELQTTQLRHLDVFLAEKTGLRVTSPGT